MNTLQGGTRIVTLPRLKSKTGMYLNKRKILATSYKPKHQMSLTNLAEIFLHVNDIIDFDILQQYFIRK